MIKHKFLTLFVALCATTALWASNTITYTATEKLGGYDGSLDIGKTTFGPAITSHDFGNGIGTITCEDEITMIRNGAFCNCSGLTSITIPNSVTTIGNRAFDGCSGLTSITIPNSVTTIGDFAFCACSGLTSITIPNSVTTIGNIAFESCSGLTSIIIPNSVTTIGNRAFGWCSDLTSVTIGNSVTTIGDWAFWYCSSLTSITIPNSVTTIGSSAFFGCLSLPVVDNIRYADTYLVEAVDKTLSSYVIKEGTKWIGDYAFSGCSGLTSVTIPNSVTTIEYSAFEDCSGLTSVTIGNSVTTIGHDAFAGCDGLTKTNYTGTIAAWCKIEFFDYSNPIQNSHNFFINNVELKDLVIPEGVDKIGNHAFEGCSGLTSVTIPNSVTTIGSRAFRGCSGLASIDVDAANTHYVSIDGVLFNYAKKTLIQYPIGNPRTEYTIPNSVTRIGSYAFCSCTDLASITIPNSVTTIADRAFYNCSGLTSVTIPNSVTTIGYVAFEDCSGLTSITCEATAPPTCEIDCFYDVDKSLPLYVPAGSIEAYQAADQWKDFTDIRPITAEEVEVTEIEAEPTESAVEIAWPSVVNAETYTIEIRLNDKLICSIVFNAQGQLVSINFNLAPGRGGHTYATTAESTATGWAYTIAGLNPGTEYTYSVIAKNANDQEIDTKSGSFTTKGVTAFENVSADVNTTKFLRNGQVIIRQGDKTYNVVGQEVK